MFSTFPLRFLLPNGITATSIVLACISIVQGQAGQYEWSAWLIVWCVLLDKADGFTAQWFNACSDFGVQLDSLADLTAFCIAPALFVYFMLTGDPRYNGIYEQPLMHGLLALTTAGYVLCGAIRLARFNIMTEEIGNAWFQGLSTTISGAIIVTFYLTAQTLSWPDQVTVLLPVMLLICAVLMISNLYLPKTLGRFRHFLLLPFIAGTCIVSVLSAMRLYPQILLLIAVLYPLIGFTIGIIIRGANSIAVSGTMTAED